MKEKTLVLGSGISALAYLFYNPDAFALAGEQVGGLFAKARDLGPQYVWKTDSTTRLLRDMGYGSLASAEMRIKTIRIGYLFNGEVARLEDLTVTERAVVQHSYAMKTRGIPPKDSYMSDGRSEFEIYSIAVEDLVKELLQRVSLRLFYHKASAVDMYRGIVLVEKPNLGLTVPFEYEYLVSTVPAPVFLKLIGKEAEAPRLKAFDKVYEKSPAYYPFEHLMCSGNNFDYVYVAGNEHPFHRVRKFDGRMVVREYTIVDGYSGPKFPDTVLTQPKGQIVSGHEVLESLPKDSVVTYGRYAQWKHGVRLEDTLEAIQ